MPEIWYCNLRDHQHSTEHEAEWCTELYDLWQLATEQLIAYVREEEVASAVNQALMDMVEEEEPC